MKKLFGLFLFAVSIGCGAQTFNTLDNSSQSFTKALFGDGVTCTAPSIAFTNQTGTGFSLNNSSGRIGLCAAGSYVGEILTNQIRIGSGTQFQFQSGGSGSANDTDIRRVSAGLIGIGNASGCVTVANCADLQLRHLIASGTIPTMGACGTSPSVVGSDTAMFVTIGTGGVATSCAVTFAVGYTNAPICMAQNDTDIVAYKMVTTTSGLTVTASAAFTASSHLHIQCIGRT